MKFELSQVFTISVSFSTFAAIFFITNTYFSVLAWKIDAKKETLKKDDILGDQFAFKIIHSKDIFHKTTVNKSFWGKKKHVQALFFTKCQTRRDGEGDKSGKARQGRTVQ